MAAGDIMVKDMTEGEFQERGLMMDLFNQVASAVQQNPELTAAALQKLTQLAKSRDEPLSNAPPEELKQAGLMDMAGNYLGPVKEALQRHPGLTIAGALAAAGLAVAAGVYVYRKMSADDTPIEELDNEELQERGLLDSSGNMLESVKAKLAENPKMTVAAALAATGLLVVGGIALSKRFSPPDTPIDEIPQEELQQRGLVDKAGNMLEPVKNAIKENPKLSIAAALAATGLVVAGGMAVHHASSADTTVADMSPEQLEQVGLTDNEGGLLSSIKQKIQENPKLSIAAALAAVGATVAGGVALHHAMKPNESNDHGNDEGESDKKNKKEKKEKGDKKEKKEKKGGKEKKEKKGKKDKKTKSRDLGELTVTRDLGESPGKGAGKGYAVRSLLPFEADESSSSSDEEE